MYTCTLLHNMAKEDLKMGFQGSISFHRIQVGNITRILLVKSQDRWALHYHFLQAVQNPLVTKCPPSYYVNALHPQKIYLLGNPYVCILYLRKIWNTLMQRPIKVRVFHKNESCPLGPILPLELFFWKKEGAKQAALILMKNSHFYRTPLHDFIFPL